LLSNGCRHTPNGGTITIRVARQADQITIAVEDTGEGLQPDEAAQIFERFYRSDDSRRRDAGGTGLGLAIVKAIVEAHEGQVSVSSQGQGMGCTFTIHLPCPESP